MKPKKRQKMCYNCEGEIDLDVIVCPFCAADLREEKPEQQRPPLNPTNANKNLGKTMESLYPSHFSQKNQEKIREKIQEDPPMEEAQPIAAAPEDGADEGKTKNILGPTILFTLGVQLCLFGILMVLFSHKGVMVLKWDARLWFLYVFASIPLLAFGYRALSKL